MHDTAHGGLRVGGYGKRKTLCIPTTHAHPAISSPKRGWVRRHGCGLLCPSGCRLPGAVVRGERFTYLRPLRGSGGRVGCLLWGRLLVPAALRRVRGRPNVSHTDHSSRHSSLPGRWPPRCSGTQISTSHTIVYRYHQSALSSPMHHMRT